MFGYVKPVRSELLVKEDEFYRAAYCGICRSMKKYTGFFSNLSLSYDGVLLALVRMVYATEEKISARLRRCVAHPFKKRPMLDINSATEYTARAFALLAYYKMRDDIADERAIKRLLLSPMRPVLRHGARRAKIPDVADIVREKLEAISALEAAGCSSVDEPAELFGELLGEIFANGLTESDALVCREFGASLGRFIYCADAAEDYEDDRRHGKYNPYVLAYGGAPLSAENKRTVRCALILECKRMEGAVALMPFGARYASIGNIVRNVIYLGLIKRIDFLNEDECATETDNANERKAEEQ